MKKIIVSFVATLIISIVICEAVLRAQYRQPPAEADPPQFQQMYVDIYDNFFTKVKSPKGYKYISQREGANMGEFSLLKNDEIIRIFIIGGSVAGIWENKSIEELKLFLQNNLFSRPVEIINCGMGGYDSYRVLRVAKEVLSYQPDLLVIMSGNNEYYNQSGFNLRAYRLNKSLRKLWVYRKAQDYLFSQLKEKGLLAPRTKEERLTDYKRNIEAMVDMAQKREVPVILCTLPWSMKDYSLKEENLPLQLIPALLSLENKDYNLAFKEVSGFLEDNQANAWGLYLLGKIFFQTGNYSFARSNFLKSQDLLKGWSCANPSSNEIIRDICFRKGAGIVDLAKIFRNTAEYGITGREQFIDNCHWYDAYYNLVSAGIIKELWKNRQAYPNLFILPPEISPKAFGYFCRLSSLKNVSENTEKKNFFLQQAAWDIFVYCENHIWNYAVSRLKALYMMDPRCLWEAQFAKKELKNRILKLHPWIKDTPPYSGYFDNYGRVFWPKFLYHIAETYRRLGMYRESLVYLNKAVAADHSNYMPYLLRALVFHSLGNDKAMRENLKRAAILSGNNSRLKYYREALSLLGEDG